MCNKKDGPLTKLTSHGIKSIKEFAKIKNNLTVQYKIRENEKLFIHKECQKDFTNRKRFSQEQKASKITSQTNISAKETRSKTNDLCWRAQCFFCEKKLNKRTGKWSKMNKLSFRDKVLVESQKRLDLCPDDKWAIKIQSKVTNCFDLVSVGAKYHPACSIKFLSGRYLY